MKTIRTKVITILLLLFILSACLPVAPITSPPDTLRPTATPAPTEEAPTSALVSNGCPVETADLKMYTNTNDGYCLLFPAEDTIIPLYLIVINPIRAPGNKPGDAWVEIVVDSASGRTAAQVANDQIAQAGEGFNITRSEILIDGRQAVVVDGLPGPDPWRVVLTVDDDRLYTLYFLPWIPTADSFAQLEALYSTVMDSFHFLPSTP